MMSIKEIHISANGLGGLLKAGAALDKALEQMAITQPDYEEFWTRAVMSVRSGRPVSESLAEEWPLALVRAVEAGEQAGELAAVFLRVQKTIGIERGVRKTFSKLYYPVGAGLAGLLVAMGYVVFVIPMMMKSLPGKHKSGLLSFALSFSDFMKERWPVVLVTLAVGMYLLVTWLRSKEGRAMLIDLSLSVPVLKIAVRNLYFGLWGDYVEMVFGSGIATLTCLQLTAPILPERLRESVDVFRADMEVNNTPMGEAAKLINLEVGDPRREWWPFYISNAFMLAEETGRIDEHMADCSSTLIEDGTGLLSFLINVANAFALAFAAVLIVTPIGLYYSELFAAARTMGR